MLLVLWIKVHLKIVASSPRKMALTMRTHHPEATNKLIILLICTNFVAILYKKIYSQVYLFCFTVDYWTVRQYLTRSKQSQEINEKTFVWLKIFPQHFRSWLLFVEASRIFLNYPKNLVKNKGGSVLILVFYRSVRCQNLFLGGYFITVAGFSVNWTKWEGRRRKSCCWRDKFKAQGRGCSGFCLRINEGNKNH